MGILPSDLMERQGESLDAIFKRMVEGQSCEVHLILHGKISEDIKGERKSRQRSTNLNQIREMEK